MPVSLAAASAVPGPAPRAHPAASTPETMFAAYGSRARATPATRLRSVHMACAKYRLWRSPSADRRIGVTGATTLMRPWYSGPWTAVLRLPLPLPICMVSSAHRCRSRAAIVLFPPPRASLPIRALPSSSSFSTEIELALEDAWRRSTASVRSEAEPRTCTAARSLASAATCSRPS